MPVPIRAILFDFDGVLVNSELLHLRAFQRAGQDAGIEITEAEYFRDCIGFDDRGCWRQLAKNRGLTLDNATLLGLLTYKAQVVREFIHSRQFSALPGVPELVRALYRDYALGICSGALREEIETMLEGIGLRDCFRVITAAEDVSRGKPDPEGYLKTASELARLTGKTIRPAHALVVEDAPRVIARARKAGFPTAGVPTHYGHDELNADYALKSLQIEDVRKTIPSLKLLVG
jgi:beta-phosphoglucomutase